MKRFLLHWLPLFVWMTLIFGASADAQSTAHTSRFLVPFLRWLHPGVTEKQIETVRWCVRKGAHLTEFAILASLTWRALWKSRSPEDRPWSWKIAGAALGICILFAATDEIHQAFVPNRTPSVRDVCIDTTGAAIGLALVRATRRSRAPG